jgi:large subunit ribosomal protein L3
MTTGLIGKKLGMTGIFSSDGRYIPVTVIQVGPCVITQIKKAGSEGYNALQLGFGEKKANRVNRPMKGHFAKSGDRLFETVGEFRVDDPETFSLGQEITLDVFAVGERVQVTGRTKGRGFSGVIKRHGFHGGKDTHGSHSHRVPGSIGCSAWPARVFKGKKLPGQYGNEQKTVKNLEIVDIRPEENLLLVRGAVPGYSKSLVTIKKSIIAK